MAWNLTAADPVVGEAAGLDRPEDVARAELADAEALQVRPGREAKMRARDGPSPSAFHRDVVTTAPDLGACVRALEGATPAEGPSSGASGVEGVEEAG